MVGRSGVCLFIGRNIKRPWIYEEGISDPLTDLRNCLAGLFEFAAGASVHNGRLIYPDSHGVWFYMCSMWWVFYITYNLSAILSCK